MPGQPVKETFARMKALDPRRFEDKYYEERTRGPISGPMGRGPRWQPSGGAGPDVGYSFPLTRDSDRIRTRPARRAANCTDYACAIAKRTYAGAAAMAASQRLSRGADRTRSGNFAVGMQGLRSSAWAPAEVSPHLPGEGRATPVAQ